jgi:phytoene/squalene synthetase
MTATPAEANTGASTDDAVAEAREVVARSGTSFHLGMRVLPKARREAIYAI